jgi:hypothetical protein
MTFQDALRKARKFISAQEGEIAPLPISEEELNPTNQYDLSVQAYPLESITSCYRVNYQFPKDSNCSKLSFFEDGRQRTVQIGYIPARYGSKHVLIPVHYFVVAVVILKRNERELKIWREPEIQSGILI